MKNKDLIDLGLMASLKISPWLTLAGVGFKLIYENKEEIFNTFNDLKNFVSKKFGKN